MALINDNHFGTTHDDYLDLSRDRPYASVAEVNVGDAIRIVWGSFAHLTGSVIQTEAGYGENVTVRVRVFGRTFEYAFHYTQIAKVG